MKIRNMVSQAVFNYELAEGHELLAKYPHLKLEQANAEEKKAMQEKSMPTDEDKILGKTAEAKEETVCNILSESEPEEAEADSSSENAAPVTEDAVTKNKLTAPEAISIPATLSAENKILGKNAKKAGN